MNGFAIQRHNHFGKEETAVIEYSILNKIPYKLFTKYEEVPKGYIPIGNVEWCEKFLPKEITIPDYYPNFLKDYLYRKVWKTDTWPLGQKVFIKPSDKHKRFSGFNTYGTYRKKKKPPFWCSDIVSFNNEWRYYVSNGKILTGEWYEGDQVNTPEAPKLEIEIPKGYCGALDFGTLKSGELALVEANSPYACGWYGKDNKIYAEWIVKGWEYLTKNYCGRLGPVV
jgi:hypothetical protein